jgi:hypothetical protein
MNDEKKTNLPAVIPKQPDYSAERSEEVQSIIERMPTYWSKWVALCVGILIGGIILLGFLIKYPDTVDGQVSVTAVFAPVRLVANSNGRLILLQADKTQIEEGTVISYIESGANYRHILWVDSLLDNPVIFENEYYSFPDSLLLGDVASAYNAFILAYQQYRRVLASDIYATIRLNLQNQINSDKLVIENLDEELKLKSNILADSEDRLKKDSILLHNQVISEQDYQQQRASHLSLKESRLSLQSNRLLKRSEISRNMMEIQRIQLEETENIERVYAEFIIQKNALANTVNLWKERYLQYSPVEGELEYLGFWRDNIFVQSGQELFTVIPDKNNIVGEVMIPSFGAGKVEVGQTANIKINNYPFDEYGLIKGVVKSVSRITKKIETSNGVSDAYLVVIDFPEGTTTNFGKYLPLDFESKGTAEIITRRKRLIERLFDNLKAKTEK